MGSLLELQNIYCVNGFREYLSKTFILQIMKNETPGGKIIPNVTQMAREAGLESISSDFQVEISQTDQKAQTCKQFVLKVLLGTPVPQFLVIFCPLLFPYQYLG